MSIHTIVRDLSREISSDPQLLKHNNGDRWDRIRQIERDAACRVCSANGTDITGFKIEYDTNRSSYKTDIAEYDLNIEAYMHPDNPNTFLNSLFEYVRQARPSGKVAYQVVWAPEALQAEDAINGLESGSIKVRTSVFQPDPSIPRAASSRYSKRFGGEPEVDGQWHSVRGDFKPYGWGVDVEGYYSERYRNITNKLKPSKVKIRFDQEDAERLERSIENNPQRRHLAPLFRFLLTPETRTLDGIIHSSVYGKPKIELKIPYSQLEEFEQLVGKSLTGTNGYTRVAEFLGSYGLLGRFKSSRRLGDVKLLVGLIEELEPPILYGHPTVNDFQARSLVEEEIRLLDAAYAEAQEPIPEIDYENIPEEDAVQQETRRSDFLRNRLQLRTGILYSLMGMQFGESFMKRLRTASLHFKSLEFFKSHDYKPSREYQDDELPWQTYPGELYALEFFKQTFARNPSPVIKGYKKLYPTPEKPEISITGKADGVKFRNMVIPKNSELGLVSVERDASSDMVKLSTKYGNTIQPASGDSKELRLFLRIGLRTDEKLLPLHDYVLKQFGIDCQ